MCPCRRQVSSLGLGTGTSLSSVKAEPASFCCSLGHAAVGSNLPQGLGDISLVGSGAPVLKGHCYYWVQRPSTAVGSLVIFLTDTGPTRSPPEPRGSRSTERRLARAGPRLLLQEAAPGGVGPACRPRGAPLKAGHLRGEAGPGAAGRGRVTLVCWGLGPGSRVLAPSGPSSRIGKMRASG